VGPGGSISQRGARFWKERPGYGRQHCCHPWTLNYSPVVREINTGVDSEILPRTQMRSGYSPPENTRYKHYGTLKIQDMFDRELPKPQSELRTFISGFRERHSPCLYDEKEAAEGLHELKTTCRCPERWLLLI
jgi:hypothetical protein